MQTYLLGKSSRTLFAGVSLAVLALAAPARGGDLALKAPAADRGEFRGFVEGGAFWTGGDPIPYNAPGTSGIDFGGGFFPIFPVFPVPVAGAVAGALPGDPSLKPKVGWDAAVGFDYRFPGTPWHVNAQGRFGQSKGSDSVGSTSNSLISFVVPGSGSETISTSAVGNTSVGLTETHWQADFGMGYDFVPRMMQINFGFRVAEVSAVATATSNASGTEVANINVPGGSTPVVGSLNATATSSDLTTVRRSFLGAGPRVGLEGSVPVIGAWAFDYSGNAALRKSPAIRTAALATRPPLRSRRRARLRECSRPHRTNRGC